MFNLEFLHLIRKAELEMVIKYLPKNAQILEIGGGTGIQAKELTKKGFKIISIDVPESNYKLEKVFPVKEYDGKNLPFPDNHFDFIFSSNVLEHIKNIDGLFVEFSRVLKKKGACLHIMPSGTWRFWTNITNYLEFLQRFIILILSLIPKSLALSELIKFKSFPISFIKLIFQYTFPPRHGEFGNCITEVYTFSSHAWMRVMSRTNFNLISSNPGGLFYTGHTFLGMYLDLSSRQKLAKFLGSACIFYYLQKK